MVGMSQIRATADVREAITQAVAQVNKMCSALRIAVEWAAEPKSEQRDRPDRLILVFASKVEGDSSQLRVMLVQVDNYWFPSVAEVKLDPARHPKMLDQELRFVFRNSWADGSLIGVYLVGPAVPIDPWDTQTFLECPDPAIFAEPD